MRAYYKVYAFSEEGKDKLVNELLGFLGNAKWKTYNCNNATVYVIKARTTKEKMEAYQEFLKRGE